MVIVPFADEQVVGFADVPFITGMGFTLTIIGALALSQGPATLTWLTYQIVVPTAVVDGVGAVAMPVPPVEFKYHSKEFPARGAAVKGTAVVPWQ
jgi:hypothetical protein